MRRPTVRPLLVTPVLVAVALLAAACSSSGPEGAAPPPGSDAPMRAGTTEPTLGDFTPTFTEGNCPSVPSGATPPATTPAVDGVVCGMVTVPLDYDDPGGETIELAVAVVAKGTGGDAEPAAVGGAPGGANPGTTPGTTPATPANTDPLLLLGGGPGESTVAPLVPALGDPSLPIAALWADRDLVVMDQRGAGSSEPALDCPEYLTGLAAVTDFDTLPAVAVETYGACHDRLVDEGIDLSAFTTANNVRDLDLVRQALEYERWNLFGTSYGARLALQAAAAQPDTTVSLVLSSPVPAEANFITDAPASMERAMDAVAEACAADADCAASYPDLATSLDTLLQQLEAEPVVLQLPDPTTGATIPFALDGSAMASLLFSLFYLPIGPSLVPYLVHEANQGNVEPLLGLASGSGFVASVSHGMQTSFLCAEEAGTTTPDDLADGGLIGDLLGAASPVTGPTLWEICEGWDVPAGDPATFEPVRTDLPMLVVTGEFDQITPPAYGETVADADPNSTYLEIDGIGHAPLLGAGPCGVRILVAFVADPAADLDTSCAEDGPGFATPEEAPQILAELQQAASGGS